MSETVHYKGKLTKIDGLDHLSFHESIQVLKNQYDIEDIDYEDEYFYSTDIVMINDIFYAMDRKEYDECDDIIEASKTDNGYEFELKFYNGGCSFREALTEAIDNAE
jgi:hypothetical protein